MLIESNEHNLATVENKGQGLVSFSEKSSEASDWLVVNENVPDFSIFKRNNDFYVEITRHLPNGYFEIEKRVKKFHTLNMVEEDRELDLYHRILKHERACEEDDCPVVTNECESIRTLIVQEILPSTRIVSSYSLLVCMVDMVKNHPLTLKKDTLKMFVSLALNLWQHEKIYMCRKSLELCRRVIQLLTIEGAEQIATHVIQYIRVCRRNLTRRDMDRLRSLDQTDFFYTPLANMTCDKECIKLISQIILSLFLHHPMDQTNNIKELVSEFADFSHFDSEEVKTALFDICCANDDDTVQLLDTVLTLYQQNSSSPLFISFLQSIKINPHTLFLFFLSRCGNTHDIIIDLLLENDSEFLPYFHRYIMYATTNAESLITALQDDDSFLTIITNTISVLEGGGFPYNTKPLVRRLVQLDTRLNELLM